MYITRVATILLIFTAGILLTGCAGKSSQQVAPAPADTAATTDTAAAGVDWTIDYVSKVPAVQSVANWDNPYGQGIIIKTSRYDIYTTMADALMLRQLPTFLESVNTEYRKSSGIKITSDSRYTVYVFDTREQWEAFSTEFTGELWPVYQKIDRGAYYTNGACVAYNIGRSDTLSMLAHEGWHQFSHRHFRYRLPAWLDEGLAMQFEGFQLHKGRYVFAASLNSIRLSGLKRAIEEGPAPKFTDLLAANPAVVIDGDPATAASRINSYYSRLYAFIRFLEEYGGGIYKNQLHALIIDGCEGRWELSNELAAALVDRNSVLTTEINRELGARVFANYYGTKLKTMEDEFSSYCYFLVYNKGRR